MPKIKNYQKTNISDTSLEIPNTIVFDSEELPESVNWAIGEKYHIELVIEKTGERKNRSLGTVESDFEIRSVRPSVDETPPHISLLVKPKENTPEYLSRLTGRVPRMKLWRPNT